MSQLRRILCHHFSPMNVAIATPLEAGGFINKKFFHPSTMRNQEKLWKATNFWTTSFAFGDFGNIEDCYLLGFLVAKVWVDA